MNSRMLDRSTAFPSANLEYGVLPAPFSCNSYRMPVEAFVLSNNEMARLARSTHGPRNVLAHLPHLQVDRPIDRWHSVSKEQTRSLTSRTIDILWVC
jgi:hypothetical protein